MNSPWLAERVRTRPLERLNLDQQTDVAIVGGGIAGLATAHKLLKDTDAHVSLIEARRVGEGATGHNAGQFIGAVERPIRSILEEFGREKTINLLDDLDRSWNILRDLLEDLSITTPIHYYRGVGGVRSEKRFADMLNEEHLLVGLGRYRTPMFVREDLYDTLPPLLRVHAVRSSEQEIASIFGAEGYCAVWKFDGAVGNSADLVECMATNLLARYPGRFSLFEETPVSSLVLHEGSIDIHTTHKTMKTREAVLATNGFETFDIQTTSGDMLNTRFHYHVKGAVGFMFGYILEESYLPTAELYFGIWDFEDGGVYGGPLVEPYMYVTRRPYQGKTLLVIGGPEDFLSDTSIYSTAYEFPTRARAQIDAFLTTYHIQPKKNPDFMWHGLMGYTRSGLRLVGRDTQHPHLLYNLGCNGIGLLPSLIGAERISALIQKHHVEPSVFDPAF